MRRRILAAAGVALLASVLPACSGESEPSQSTATATYAITPRPVRPDEKAVRLAPAIDGDTAFTVIGLTTGLPELAGSHADVKARGQFVRVRLVLVNNGRTTTLMDMMKDRLVTADGQAHRPDYDAMIIKRQPMKMDVGAAVRVEFDLWFDIPAAARPVALRLYGGATLTDMKDEEGTDLRLP